MSGLLKFITCGSVDDGKSTLIGHILYDSKLLYADQEKALELDSKVGSRGGAIDYSLLPRRTDGRESRESTIDVAYRYFTTDKRSFIVADTPGHEEFYKKHGCRCILCRPCGNFNRCKAGRIGSDKKTRKNLRAHGNQLLCICCKQDGSCRLRREAFR